MKTKKILTLSLILVIIIFLGGCWNRIEPEKYSWLAWVGLDRLPDGDVKVTVVVAPPLSPVPTGSSPPENLMLVSSSSGKTVFEAVRKINGHLPKRLFWPYLQAVIIGEDLARTGVEQNIDLLFRNVRPRKNAWVFVTRGTTESIFNLDPQFEKNPAKLIDSLVNAEQGFLGTSRVIRLKDFQSDLEGAGVDCVVSVLGVWDAKNEKMLPTAAKVPQKGEPALDGSAVFRGDKLVGWLSQEESQAYLLAKGEMKTGLIVVPHPDNPQNLAGIEVIGNKAKLSAKIVDDQPIATLSITVGGKFGDERLDEPGIEVEGIDEDLNFYSKLDEELECRVKSAVDNLFEKSLTEFDSDILGIGDYIMNRYPNDWKRVATDWREHYRRTIINVEVKANITTSNILRPRKIDNNTSKKTEPAE